MILAAHVQRALSTDADTASAEFTYLKTFNPVLLSRISTALGRYHAEHTLCTETAHGSDVDTVPVQHTLPYLVDYIVDYVTARVAKTAN